MWGSVKSMAVRFLGGLAIAVLLVLVLDVLWGVVTRWAGDQASWSEELARFLLVWVSFLGAAIAYLDDKHLGVDILYTALHPSARRLCRAFTHLVVLGFSLGVLGIGGSMLVADRFDAGQMMPALSIHKAWMYLAVPVSGFLISLFAVGNVFSSLAGEEAADGEEASS